MKWNTSESSEFPIAVEENHNLFYIRKNIIEVARDNTTFYTYDECVTDAQGLAKYMSDREIINRTNIEYIAMLSDIELESEV